MKTPRNCIRCGKSRSLCPCPTFDGREDVPPETMATYEARLSQAQKELVAYLRFRDKSPKGRVLHRFDGGFWASATERLGPVENNGGKSYRVPVRYWSTGTVDALAVKGILVPQERKDKGGRMGWKDYILHLEKEGA